MTDTAIQETPQWEAIIRQVDTGDRVLGGADGAVNIAYRQLANRTGYLKQQIGELNEALPKSATDTQAGLVKLINNLTSTDATAALSAAQGKVLADSKVDKTDGVTLSTHQTITGYKTFTQGLSSGAPIKVDYVNDWVGFIANQPTEGKNIFFDAYVGDVPRGGMQVVSGDNGQYSLRLMVTPAGSTTSDRRVAGMIVYDGSIWTKAYGWIHEIFCPSGMIMTFASDFAPAGWLKANGAAVSRTAYAKLFAAIGTRYGAGDGHSTFNLPDLRGEFARFWDDGRGVDAGRGLGTWQGDAIRNIAGNAATYTQDEIQPNGAFSISNKAKRGIMWEDNWKNYGVQAQLDFDASRVVPTANENRPRNIALLACIKI